MKRNAVSNLPRQTTALIGRDQQLGELRRLLQDLACRLLTLVGPGGIGKTRLAIAVAESVEGYADGVAYVPLQAVASADLLAPAIAKAAGIMLAGQEPLPMQLFHHLRTKHLLLVLDNFEHLLAGTDLLVDILHEAPHIKLLLTSREALSVREEWRYPVPGLPFPAQAEKGDPTAYGAIQLFADRARQIRPDFDLAAEVEAVLAICRAVEGMPLAIELAASWLTVLDSAAIVERLRHSLDILTTPLRNVPPRHQSMHAVFDQSWQMLTPEERNSFMQLAVFRGGISYPAAAAVADATLPIMAALVAKSLVRREGNGRYRIHELLRQYGIEKLAESPEREEAAHRAHSAYFMQFLADRHLLFFDSRQLQAAREIGGELDNIRQAWQWALEHLEIEWLRRGGHALYNFSQTQGRYLEAIDLFQDASHHLETDRMTPARAAVLVATLTAYAWLCIRLGRLAEADRALARARQLYDEFQMSPAPQLEGDTLMPTMFLALTRGDYDQATAVGEQLLRIAAAHALPVASAIPHYGMASAAFAKNDYPRAKAHAEQGLTLAAAGGNPRYMSALYGMLGQIVLAEDDLAAAKRHFEAAYAICDACADRGGMAEHLSDLAGVALLQREWQEARTLWARSHAVYTEIGDRGGIARTQLGTGIVGQRTEERDAAARHYRLALTEAVDAHIVPVILSIAAAVGDFLLQTKDTRALGQRALSFVLHHPSCDGRTRKQVLDSLAQTEQTPDEIHATPDTDTMMSLAAALQAALAAPSENRVRIKPLVEPLTARESVILRLLASGRSNPEIAAALVIAVGTVKAHTNRIYRKLDVVNRTQAVVRARELGLLA